MLPAEGHVARLGNLETEELGARALDGRCDGRTGTGAGTGTGTGSVASVSLVGPLERLGGGGGGEGVRPR